MADDSGPEEEGRSSGTGLVMAMVTCDFEAEDEVELSIKVKNRFRVHSNFPYPMIAKYCTANTIRAASVRTTVYYHLKGKTAYKM